MIQEFEDLHEKLQAAAGEAYPEIPDFTLKAESSGFVTYGRVDVLDNPASEFDRILKSYLDKEGDLVVKETNAQSDELAISYELYAAREKMLKNLDDTVAEIEADTLELSMMDLGDFQRLKYLNEVFTCYKLFLTAECSEFRKKFVDTVKRSLGGRIRQIRQQQGLTIGEFADRVYLSRIEMNRYELGSRVPPVATLFQIAHTFDVSADWLLGVKRDDENR